MFSILNFIAVLHLSSVLWNPSSAYGGGVCHLPAETGPCRGYFPRWFFNMASMKCEKFIYGGCQGNDNRFDTEKKCLERCKCFLPKDPGPCKGKFPRWFYNKKTKSCEMFTYGGCKGNANNFETKEECIESCDPCSLPPDPGPCDGYFPKWFYNKKMKRCELFTYGGCEGNANRFDTEEECRESCDPCCLPSDTGPCRAYFRRWFYNKKTKKCERFIYGGCLGNDNNFESKKECEKVCNPCYYPKDSGPCYAKFTRYYYNYMKKKCKKFIYGGCGGNSNNFETKKMCNKACKKKY